MFNRARSNGAIFLIASLCLVAGCSNGIKESLGLTGSSPDEFRVVSNPPLVVPPEFTLRPPMPGAKGPLYTNSQEEAKNILYENPQNAAGKETKGEEALLRKADAGSANPEIREDLIRDEQSVEDSKKKKGFLGKVASYTGFSKKDPLVNPQKEKERIQNNQKEGKPANEGDVVTKQPSQGGLLNNVFGF